MPGALGYHINADWPLAETAAATDAQGRTTNRILVTSLANRAMPLIRYEIGDTGELLAERCPCGRGLPLMRPTWGGSADYLALVDGTVITPYDMTCAIEHLPGMQRYQIVQRSIDRVEVLVLPGVGITPDLPGAIRTAPRGRCCTASSRRCAWSTRCLASRAQVRHRAPELHGPHRHRPMAERSVARRGAIPRLLARPAATAVATDPGLAARRAHWSSSCWAWARRRPGGAFGPVAYGTWSLLRVSQHYLVNVSAWHHRGVRGRGVGASRPSRRQASPTAERFAAAGNGFLVLSYGTFSALAAAAGLPGAGPGLCDPGRPCRGHRGRARVRRVPPSSRWHGARTRRIEPRPRQPQLVLNWGLAMLWAWPAPSWAWPSPAGGLAMMRGRVPMRIGRGPPSAT